MWFQIDLIVITVLYILIFKLLPNKVGDYTISIIAAIALIMQYSGINMKTLGNLPNEYKYTLGRLFEMIPYATIGVLFAKFRIYEIFQKKRIISMVFCMAGIVMASALPGINGYGYSGVRLILIAICLVGFFYLLPCEWIPVSVKRILSLLSRYAMGIYYMHRLVGIIINVLFVAIIPFNWDGKFIGCLIIRTICMLISVSIGRMNLKWCRDIVS